MVICCDSMDDFLSSERGVILLIRALCYPLTDGEPDAKYLLARFAQCLENDESVGSGVKGVAKRFGLSDRQVSSSLKVLKGCDVLTTSRVRNRRGRPTETHRLHDGFVSGCLMRDQSGELQEGCAQPVFNEAHKALIVRLLQFEASKMNGGSTVPQQSLSTAELRAKRQPGRLSIANRVLLSVLLCYADRFGVVRDVGSSVLQKATGLNQQRLKRRIDQLIAQGLIRACIPGATGSALFKKIQSTYYLNLQHPELSSHAAPAILVCSWQSRTEDQVWDHAAYMLKATAAEGGQRASRVRHFFAQKQERQLTYLLRSRLEYYASYLLSRHWGELLSMDFSQELLALIKTDFPRKPRVSLLGLTVHDLYELLAMYLHEQAAAVARNIKRSLEEAQFEGLKIASMDYVVLPRSLASRKANVGQPGAIAVLAFARGSGTALAGCHVSTRVEAPEGALVLYRHFTNEADIPVEDRMVFGLLSSPGDAMRS